MPQQLILVLSTVTTGLSAGVLAAYALAVMPGLRRTDDATFVAAFAAVDRAIVNPVFLGGIFFASPVLVLVGCLVRSYDRPVLGWVALGLALLVVVVTIAVNVPLNDALKAAASTEAPETVRAAFHESRWVAANLVRTVLDIAALTLLVLAGRP